LKKSNLNFTFVALLGYGIYRWYVHQKEKNERKATWTDKQREAYQNVADGETDKESLPSYSENEFMSGSDEYIKEKLQ